MAAPADFGYSRVSVETDTGGNLQTQAALLEAEGIRRDRIYTDTGSGMTPPDKRPGWTALMGVVESGDCVIIPRLDRLSRSLAAGIAVMDSLVRQGVGVRCLAPPLAFLPHDPAGRLMVGVLMAFAEFEWQQTRERIREGLARAKAEGRQPGKPPIPPGVRAAIVAQVLDGGSISQTARDFGVSAASVKRFVAAERASRRADAAPTAPAE